MGAKDVDDMLSPKKGVFSPKEKFILERNKKFFSSNRKYIDQMLSIINGESEISIRDLDWFITNYSKKKNIFYKIQVCGRIELFYVNNEYKNQLNGYSKRYFDPFCRKQKVIYRYRNTTVSTNNTGVNKKSKYDVVFETSIGQLNFFQWAIRNKVIHYVKSHLDEIAADMNATLRESKQRKKTVSCASDNRTDSSDHRKENKKIDYVSPDRDICSSENVATICISSSKNRKSVSSSGGSKRQQLSKSVYEYGMKKTNVPVSLTFD